MIKSEIVDFILILLHLCLFTWSTKLWRPTLTYFGLMTCAFNNLYAVNCESDYTPNYYLRRQRITSAHSSHWNHADVPSDSWPWTSTASTSSSGSISVADISDARWISRIKITHPALYLLIFEWVIIPY